MGEKVRTRLIQQLHFGPGDSIEIDTGFRVTAANGEIGKITLTRNPLKIDQERITPKSGKGGIG
jgi:hypothetical protein